MRIKPPGSDRNLQQFSKDSEISRTFVRILAAGKENPPGSAKGTPGEEIKNRGLEKIAAQYRRSDLRDPVKVELIAVVEGAPVRTDKVVVFPGQCVALRLRVRYRNGAVADLGDDAGFQVSAEGGRGQFTATHVWCPQPEDAGHTVTLEGRYLAPSGKQLLGKRRVTVRKAAGARP